MKKETKSDIENNVDFRRTGSEKANQLGPSSPYERNTDDPQGHAARSGADNDADRLTEEQEAALHHGLRKDADQAQHDGNLSFPEGK
ncbi:MAG TPA: hypothetical protein VF145_03530 [Chitinophagaceae bacterium]